MKGLIPAARRLIKSRNEYKQTLTGSYICKGNYKNKRTRKHCYELHISVSGKEMIKVYNDYAIRYTSKDGYVWEMLDTILFSKE